MKRIAFAAAVLLLAACSPREEAPAVDTAAAPTMAPAPMDTMRHDTGMMRDTIVDTTIVTPLTPTTTP